MNRVRKCVGLLVCCALLALMAALSGCGQDEPSDDMVEAGGHYCGPYELMMNGEIYRFMDIARYEPINGGSRVAYVNSPSTAYLPEGYTEYGPAVTVERRPEKDGEAALWSGTIYVSDATPEAVYLYADVVSRAYNTSTPHYVRFVSEALYEGHDLIRWNGADYHISGEGEVLDALPAACQELGTLTFIGRDALPQEDLQTNCPAYAGGFLVDGWSVCADPADPAHLYVQVTVWRDGGEQQAYHVCDLVTEE